MDGNRTEHTYPRSTDQGSTGWMTVSNSQTNTFDINIGATPLRVYNPTASTYDPTTGHLTLTIGDHILTPGTHLRMSKESLSFKCDMDGLQSIKKYPRTTDPVYGKPTPILYDGDQRTITNATYTPSTGVMTISAGKSFTPDNIDYNPTTGLMTLTIPNHGLTVNDKIKIADNTLKFTCAQDDHATIHTYPRSTDPKSGLSMTLSNVTTHTFSVQVLNTLPSTNTTEHKFVSAVTNCVISDKHGFANKDRIKLTDASLVFTCALDGNQTDHAYPRSTDPYRGRWLAVSNVTDTTFNVNVGISPDKSTHTFKSAAANGLIKRDGTITIDVGKSPEFGHDVTGATYDPATGNMVLTVGTHNIPCLLYTSDAADE